MVLDEASAEFNLKGVAGASFSVIASRVGLSRASLYNYAADRQSLVMQCYLRACDRVRDDLQRISTLPGSGLDRLIVFLQLSLDDTRLETAVLSELGFLELDQQGQVRAARKRNIASLSELLLDGVADGSIRLIDVPLACEALLGMISWRAMSSIWIDSADSTFRARMRAAVGSMVRSGLIGPAYLSGNPASLINLPPAAGFSGRAEQLLEAASRLFNSFGIDGTSLDDIALACDATKGAIYHHFDNKAALVAACYDRAFQIYEQIMDIAEMQPTGIDASRAAITLNVQAQMGGLHPLSLTTGFGNLPAKLKTHLSTRVDALTRRGADLSRRGAADGTLREHDYEMVSLASAGTFSFLARWLHLPSSTDLAALGQKVGEFVLIGFASHEHR